MESYFPFNDQNVKTSMILEKWGVEVLNI